jgi:hypothetical protein
MFAPQSFKKQRMSAARCWIFSLIIALTSLFGATQALAQ